MKAARISAFGPPSVIAIENVPRPEPGSGQLLVRVKAAGVGPWDALVREGKSALHQPLPLILGSELAGTVEAIGPEVSGFKLGDEVYGATNELFTGAYAECALASAGMMTQKPKILSDVEAASAPVVTVTAWQMLSIMPTQPLDKPYLSTGRLAMWALTPCNSRRKTGSM